MKLDEEQRCQVAAALRRARATIGAEAVDDFISNTEAGAAEFGAQKRDDAITYRMQHDDLRELWLIAYASNPDVERILACIDNLPPPAARRLDRLALLSIKGLRKMWAAEERRGKHLQLQPEPFWDVLKGEGFRAWAKLADPGRLVQVIQVTAANGANPVANGSEISVEPYVMGHARGLPDSGNKGGRPSTHYRSFTLIGHLAHHWERVTEVFPEPGRSDKTAFGELIHSVFDWMGAGSPEQALRDWWAEMRRPRAHASPAESNVAEVSLEPLQIRRD